MNIPKKYQMMIESVDHDDDGWWIYLNYGWCCAPNTHIIHEDTQKEALNVLRHHTKPCDCEECRRELK